MGNFLANLNVNMPGGYFGPWAGGGVAELELTEGIIYDTVYIKVFKLIYVIFLT